MAAELVDECHLLVGFEHPSCSDLRAGVEQVGGGDRRRHREGCRQGRDVSRPQRRDDACELCRRPFDVARHCVGAPDVLRGRRLHRDVQHRLPERSGVLQLGCARPRGPRGVAGSDQERIALPDAKQDLVPPLHTAWQLAIEPHLEARLTQILRKRSNTVDVGTAVTDEHPCGAWHGRRRCISVERVRCQGGFIWCGGACGSYEGGKLLIGSHREVVARPKRGDHVGEQARSHARRHQVLELGNDGLLRRRIEVRGCERLGRVRARNHGEGEAVGRHVAPARGGSRWSGRTPPSRSSTSSR